MQLRPPGRSGLLVAPRACGGNFFGWTTDERTSFALLDAFVDAREFGSAKPDPEPYLRAAEALHTAPERIVFLDDAQYCIDGSERVGMTGVLVDPIDKLPAFDRARVLLGLPVGVS